MISVVIPAKYEPLTISTIVNKSLRYCNEVIVVLSSSDSATIEQVPSFAKIVFEEKQGKGFALRTAVENAKGEIVVFIDADLSHNPADIPLVTQPILDGNADLVVASRMLGGSSELFYNVAQFVRLCGSHVITLCINRKYGARLTDSQNGFRAIRRDLFLSLDLRERHTTIEQEITVKALRKNARVIEIPSHEYSRAAGVSKIKVFRDGWRYLFLLLKFILESKPKEFQKRDMAVIHSKYNKAWSEK